MKYFYLLASIGGLALLVLEAPEGKLLGTTPERGRVEKKESSGSTGRTVRSPGFFFIGGYHGGK